MALRWGSHRREIPRVNPVNTVLKNKAQVDAAVAEAARLKLPQFSDPPKTWDTLGALHEIVSRTDTSAKILDAGAEMYSRILPWLYLYGYRDLTGNNLIFDKSRTVKRGTINYEYGDITATRFEKAHFDAITCLSVVEHGVDLDKYFAEMARILKPGGVLVTSTDYFEQPTDTKGLECYGTPIRVFTRADIEKAVEGAKKVGLRLSQPMDYSSQDRVVTWKQFGLKYSFIIFSMIRQ
jgi:SAM-dependent methyltransferase